MSPTPTTPVFRCRSIFISDIHLGFRGCRAHYLLDLLHSVQADAVLTEDFESCLSLLRWTEQRQVVAHTGMVATLPVGQAA